jgi:glutathione S-transferase
MKLYYAAMAPNPDRVRFFLQEKGAWDSVERCDVAIMKGEHRSEAYRAISPLGHVPALVTREGEALTESRAICVYLEGVFPEPNLMGATPLERARIEMWDRRVELVYMTSVAGWFRHGHPAMAPLESPQSQEFSQICARKSEAAAAFFDARLKESPYVAGERFTIADITLFVTLGFGRLMKFKPWEQLPALDEWRNRMNERPGLSG